MALRRLFVANRGEIAVRIIHAARALGIETVLGCSAADRDSLGAELADRCVTLGPAAAARSYLDEKLVVHAALATGCDALHPGYGFLSERAGLARLCEDNGIVFVGPRAETIEQLGDKLSARAIAQRNGVPLVPGSAHVADAESAVREAATLGYPVVMKASAGGGGRGMAARALRVHRGAPPVGLHGPGGAAARLVELAQPRARGMRRDHRRRRARRAAPLARSPLARHPRLRHGRRGSRRQRARGPRRTADAALADGRARARGALLQRGRPRVGRGGGRR
ncbi:biotin carboxylase N-terminal domain-containing protein, partial [Algiphilus sp.]|uniref:biotin carboxylase N-terminal domain-containing protein n=1 Tax=Algiphilus sp. TaxID=1872431 RepID=UPI003C57739A